MKLDYETAFGRVEPSLTARQITTQFDARSLRLSDLRTLEVNEQANIVSTPVNQSTVNHNLHVVILTWVKRYAEQINQKIKSSTVESVNLHYLSLYTSLTILVCCLFIYLCICSFACLFVCLFVCLFIYLFVCLFVYLFICLFLYLFVCLFVCLFICLFTYLFKTMKYICIGDGADSEIWKRVC